MPGVKGQKSGGRNRKTTAELAASGGFRKDRHGNRVDSQPAKGSPQQPPDMTEAQQRLWEAVVNAMPEAALGEADSSMMAELCRWFQVYLDHMVVLEKAPPGDMKLINATVKAWQEFRKIAIDYGLTPQSRAAIKIPSGSDQEESAFESIISRMGGSTN